MKNCKKWMLLAGLVLFLTLLPKTSLLAASVEITAMSNDRSIILVKATKPLTDNNQYYDLKVMNGSKIVSEATISGEGNYVRGLSKNKIYDLYVRTVTWDSTTSQYTYGEWSHVKKFTTMRCIYKGLGKNNSKGFSIKTPKIKGITKYKVYIGYKSNYQWSKGVKFKQCATIKAGKKKSITKYKGKSFRSRTGAYFVRVIPQNKKGRILSFSIINNAYDLTYTLRYRY